MLWRKLIKQQLVRIGLLLSLCLVVPCVVVPLAAAGDNTTQRDAHWLRAWQDLQQLSADDMAGRATGTAGNQAARQFYEQMGAELLIEQPFTWDGLDLMETGYGWRDLTALRQACAE